MKTISKRTKYILIYFLLVVFFLAGLVMPANRTVFAGESLQDFEYMETVENLYEYRNYDDVTLIRFYENEYGRESKYSLSFYVYNPNRVKFAVDTRNKVQIGYANNYTDVFRSQYKKYTITKDGQSETGLFVRFKISGFNMPIDVDRFYCISGIELVTAGDQNATEYTVGAVYQCNTINNITTISTSTLPTCEVDVNHTCYRTNYSSKDFSWRNQLSMCYFALPKNVSGIGNYGTLEAVTAEFYNYYTEPILIVDDKVIYEEIYNNYLGKSLKENSNLTIEYWVDPIPGYGSQISTFLWAYTREDAWNVVAWEHLDTLHWVFYDEIKEGEPDFSSEDYKFSGEYLRAYFYNYSEQYGRDKAIEDLFISESKYKEENLNLSGFDYGYNKHTYSIAEKRGVEDDVFGYGLKFDNASWVLSMLGITSSETKEVLPLVKISIDDLNLSDEKFSEKYFIEKDEVSSIKAYVVQQAAMNKETWILRYDVCEYYGAEAILGSGGGDFFAMESVYLDFDILSFRFAQQNSKYTIAVNMSPEDVFNDITGVKQPDPWWKKLLDWLKGLFSPIAAWGFFVLMTAAGLLGLWFILKLIRYIYDISQNWVVRLLTFLVFFAITFTIYYFYIRWVISVIASLGGLW